MSRAIVCASFFVGGVSILLCTLTCQTHVLEDSSMEGSSSAPDANVLEHLTDNEIEIATLEKQKATAKFRFLGGQGFQ